MNLESLLVSNDPALQAVLRPTLEKLSVHVTVCNDCIKGQESLTKNKFDAIIVDCDDMPGGAELLQGLRTSQSNSKAVSFAVVSGNTTTQQAFQRGANFVLQKPLTPLHAKRCFHAALTFMLRERRRYFRCPLEMPVYIRHGKTPEFTAKSTNLSEGGMAIHSVTKPPKDSLVSLRFTLPNSVSLELKGEVAWIDGIGRIGVRFLEVPQSSQFQLDHWLTERLQFELPRFVLA
jgi:CheY-like chemotaxis protein